jgi:hypothetical protein
MKGDVTESHVRSLAGLLNIDVDAMHQAQLKIISPGS